MSVVRIAVVGAGNWGRNHVRTLASMPDLELAAVCDTDDDRRAELSRQYPGVRITESLDEALEGADGVVVATPVVSHVPALPATSALLGPSMTKVVEEYASHDPRGDGEEVRPVRTAELALIPELQPGVVEQIGGSQRMTGVSAEDPGSKDVKLLVEPARQILVGFGSAVVTSCRVHDDILR